MVNRRLKQYWPCPNCGSPTRNTKTQGDFTFKKCDTCGKNTKVLLNEDHTEVIKIVGAKEKVQVESNMAKYMQSLMAAEQTQKKEPIKLNLRVKQREDVIVEPVPTQEESMKILAYYFG